MLAKNNILTVSLTLTLCLAVSMGVQGLGQYTACTTASCEKVHAAPFGSLFSIPLGLWAIPGLVFVMVLHLKKRRSMVSCALAAMLGAEIYLTFIQLYFIRALCLVCMCFLALLCLSLLLAVHKSTLARSGLIACLFFFGFHFLFFFPDIEPRCTMAQLPSDTRIEVFGSPSCSHCKEAIAQLEGVCSNYGADLVVRPVPLSPADYEATLDWVCSLLFEKKSQSAKRLGLKILWENQRSLKELEPNDATPVTLPVILATTPQGTRLFRGWHEEFKERLSQLFENHALGRFNAGMDAMGNAQGKACAPKACSQ